MTATADPKIIVALDYPSAEAALPLVEQLSPSLCKLKVGKELFTAEGPALIRLLVNRGYDIFLDLKFHDIPTTVAKACLAAADLGVWMLNVHCLGGRQMMQLTADKLKAKGHKTHLIGVTILTSLDTKACEEVGLPGNISKQVLHLGMLAQECGLDGVVCSAQESASLREQCGKSFLLVTPGIRDESSPSDDQQRTVTPAHAIASGSDYLVVGRMITQAARPLEALEKINRVIESELMHKN